MMPSPHWMKRTAVAAAVVLLTGCASVNMQNSVQTTNLEVAAFTQGNLQLATQPEQRQAMSEKAREILAEPLSQTAAVDLMLTNSPKFQAMLAEHWSVAAQAAQGGRIHNPVFAFERVKIKDELELGRVLSFGLLDLLTLPARYGIAQSRLEMAQLKLTSDVVEQVVNTRKAWVDAVAAREALRYAEMVFESAQTSADLARKMQEAGNFNRLDRARQQAFYADAALNLASARHKAVSTREVLARHLGLNFEQLGQLKLPDRLPELPAQPMPASEAGTGTEQRLDVRMAKLGFQANSQSQTLGTAASFLDVEAGIRYDTIFENDTGERANKRGWELEFRLPIFDWGGMKRADLNAQTLQAANQLEATLLEAGSTMREAYSAYRTTYDIARHYRDEVVPLRRTIADENLLLYNGMFIGVFELMADSRDQVATVVRAIEAQAEFWRADAALRATMVGRPLIVGVSSAAVASGGGGGAGH